MYLTPVLKSSQANQKSPIIKGIKVQVKRAFKSYFFFVTNRRQQKYRPPRKHFTPGCNHHPHPRQMKISHPQAALFLISHPAKRGNKETGNHPIDLYLDSIDWFLYEQTIVHKGSMLEGFSYFNVGSNNISEVSYCGMYKFLATCLKKLSKILKFLKFWVKFLLFRRK